MKSIDVLIAGVCIFILVEIDRVSDIESIARAVLITKDGQIIQSGEVDFVFLRARVQVSERDQEGVNFFL